MNYGTGSSLTAASLPVTGLAFNFPLWVIVTTATLIFVSASLLSLIRKPGKDRP